MFKKLVEKLVGNGSFRRAMRALDNSILHG
jgi:hypothetical protein